MDPIKTRAMNLPVGDMTYSFYGLPLRGWRTPLVKSLSRKVQHLCNRIMEGMGKSSWEQVFAMGDRVRV
jgi:hypothetical protein